MQKVDPRIPISNTKGFYDLTILKLKYKLISYPSLKRDSNNILQFRNLQC